MRDTPALRSWLFVSSIDDAAAAAALKACPDVVILEFEDFTPPERRPEGRRRLPELTEAFRAAGIEVAVRINPIFDPDGPLDLAAALSAGIRRIAFPKTRGPQDVHLVAKAIEDFDAQAEISSVYRLIPNIETAAALRQSYEIATAHPAVEACLVASEDMAADLGRIETAADWRCAMFENAFWSIVLPPAWPPSTAPIPGAILMGLLPKSVSQKHWAIRRKALSTRTIYLPSIQHSLRQRLRLRLPDALSPLSMPPARKDRTAPFWMVTRWRCLHIKMRRHFWCARMSLGQRKINFPSLYL